MLEHALFDPVKILLERRAETHLRHETASLGLLLNQFLSLFNHVLQLTHLFLTHHRVPLDALQGGLDALDDVHEMHAPLLVLNSPVFRILARFYDAIDGIKRVGHCPRPVRFTGVWFLIGTSRPFEQPKRLERKFSKRDDLVG